MTRDPPADPITNGDPGPSTSSKRYDQPVGAIVVDDEEVDHFDSDTDSEAAEHTFSRASRSGRPSLIFGGTRTSPPRDRFASVSMDEEEEFFNTSSKQNGTASKSTKDRNKRRKVARAGENDVKVTRADAGQESVEEDSRYGATAANRKTRRQAQAAQLKSAQDRESDSDSASASDGIVALDSPPRASAPSHTRVNANDRSAFWASKGQKQIFEVLDSDED